MKYKDVSIGTEDLVGAVILSVDWNEMTLEKDERKLRMELEYEQDFNSMCDCSCSCGISSAYFRAYERVEKVKK